MNRETIVEILRNHMDELRELGIRSSAIFGSVARGDFRPDSDIDLLVELEPPYTFDRYMKAKFYLEDILERPVDLVMEETLKPRVRPHVEKEAIRVS